jgi:hypothetical protein
LGAGAYMGKGEIEYTDALKNYYKDLGESIENEDQDFNTAFGFNFGGGLDYTINNSTIFYSEFVYHIVEREVDDEESESFSANNWAIQIGVQFGF